MNIPSNDSIAILIPARGGSKGLPNKNILPLLKKPLIVHSIECALDSKLTTNIFVSTDSQQIADISLKAGAQVPYLRPAELAGDESQALDVYLNFISYTENQNQNLKTLIVLLPTSPLRLPLDIINAYKIFQETGATSVISMKNAEQPLEWYKVLNEKECLSAPNGIPLNNIANRQKNIKYFLPNGSIYIFNVEALKNHKKYYFENTRPYIMPANRSIDIDTQQDFDYAEFILSRNSHAN